MFFTPLDDFQELVHINRPGVQCLNITDVTVNDNALNLDARHFIGLYLESRSPNFVVIPPFFSYIHLIDTDSESP